MKFIYVGEGLETIAYGLTFPKGVGVEVADSHAVKKLTNNTQFMIDGSGDDPADVPAPPKRDEQAHFKPKAGRPKGR